MKTKKIIVLALAIVMLAGLLIVGAGCTDSLPDEDTYGKLLGIVEYGWDLRPGSEVGKMLQDVKLEFTNKCSQTKSVTLSIYAFEAGSGVACASWSETRNIAAGDTFNHTFTGYPTDFEGKFMFHASIDNGGHTNSYDVTLDFNN